MQGPQSGPARNDAVPDRETELSAHDLSAYLVQQASPEAFGAHGVYRIWPGTGVPPGSEGWTWAERTVQIPWTTRPRRYTRNVVVPTLTVFRPAPERANGTAMVIAPGGAFHFLMIDHEGHDMGRWLAERGITAFVLKYRLGRTPDDDSEVLAFRNDLQARLAKPGPNDTSPPARAIDPMIRIMGEEDGRQAIRFVRTHAAEFGIAADRIGIAGFSAGGGVSMGVAMQHDAASRPDYAVGVYPAWRGDLTVPDAPPPLFLVIADDDAAVAPVSSTRLYEAWHRTGQSAELHVFANGAHGFGMAEEKLLSDAWTGLLANWLTHKGFLPNP